MNELDLLARGLARLTVRCKILEQDNALLRQELEKSKGLRAVETPPEEVKADAD